MTLTRGPEASMTPDSAVLAQISPFDPPVIPLPVDGHTELTPLTLARAANRFSEVFPGDPAALGGNNKNFEYSITRERIDAMIDVLGGDKKNPTHQQLARLILTQAGLSAYYAEMGQQNYSTIFKSHFVDVAGLILSDGTLELRLQISPNKSLRPGSIKYNVAFSQSLKDQPVCAGNSDLVFMPYPRKEGTPPLTTPSNGTDYSSYEEIAIRKISGEQINAFANVSGDHQKAHTDDEYMEKSVFGGPRIAHGILTASVALMDAMSYLQELTKEHLVVSHMSIDWLKPVPRDSTLTTKILFGDNNDAKLVMLNEAGEAVLTIDFGYKMPEN